MVSVSGNDEKRSLHYSFTPLQLFFLCGRTISNNPTLLKINDLSKQISSLFSGYASGYAIDARSCYDPLCKFVKEYKQESNKSNDDECSHYYWRKGKPTSQSDNYGWNACSLKRNYYRLGYGTLRKERKDDYEKITIGITRCLQTPIHHQWGNASGTGIYH